MKRWTILVILILFTFVLYACKKESVTTLTFISEDVNVAVLKSNINPFVMPEPPIKKGHTFLGWFLSIEATEPFDLTVFPNEDTTLYAKFQINTYQLALYVGDTVYSVTDIPYNQALNTPVLSAPFGHYFKGWLDDQGVAYSQMPDHDLVLFSTIAIRIYEMPVVSIDLPVHIQSVNQDQYVQANISILNKNETYMIENQMAEFKGRGNGSWSYDQKSYRIKFSQKQTVFSEASSRHWVIVPAGHDTSSLRSHLAFKITKSVLNHIEYSSENTLVEVFINGQYHGVYQWMEHVRVANGRVDIASDYGVIDTGYLLEYDSYASGNDGIDYFWVPGLKYAFSVHSPDPTEYSPTIDEATYRQQIIYIQSYMTQVNQAIFNRDFSTLLNLVDMDSMVDMYIIHELFKNTDTGWSSFYMYKKPGGKLYFGPIWDFDFTAGISRGDSSTSGIYVGDSALYHSDFTSSEWYISLMTQPDFVARFKTRYQAITGNIGETIISTFQTTNTYGQSFQRDAIKWSWHGTWQYDQSNLRQWLLNRNQWLNNYTK